MMCANGFLEAARLRSLSAFVFFSLHIFQGARMVTRKTSKVSSQQSPLPIGHWRAGVGGGPPAQAMLLYVDSSTWADVRHEIWDREQKKNFFHS